MDQPFPSGLAIAVKTFDDVAVVSVAGDVDHDVRAMLRETLAVALVRRPRAVVVDLAEVRFFGSTGLSALAWLHQAAETAAIEVTLVATQRSVLKPLTITRLDTLFPIHPTVTAALGRHGRQQVAQECGD
ncbi:STAS domain-containing protein [Amycolatopsis australiensis]|uniref:Anti-sigma factor antagonist n=1 Tax=Amycolatopsis australiensis TaxID=546364 RepID=A0A1K1R644_9PSEU|nr:STAS domain-containing protein [Amycolatopsis australiensis]SFW67568.1 anti-anti-sigma factor [Amycolatopsis australiensis]